MTLDKRSRLTASLSADGELWGAFGMLPFVSNVRKRVNAYAGEMRPSSSQSSTSSAELGEWVVSGIPSWHLPFNGWGVTLTPIAHKACIFIARQINAWKMRFQPTLPVRIHLEQRVRTSNVHLST